MSQHGARPEARRASPAATTSVITIFHNEERFLPEAVESVLAQTDPRWELLLVDDGSTDGSPAIARELADRHPDRIRYLRHPDNANLGMSASRNAGLVEAGGRWLTFLDADDVWLPDKLERQLALLDAHPGIEVLASPAQWWWSWAEAPEQADWLQRLKQDRGEAAVVSPPTVLAQFLDDEWASVCDLIIGTETARRLGGYEREFTGMFEDQVFHAKVFSRLPALITDGSWYRYRQHPNACTASAHVGGDHRVAKADYLTWLGRYLASNGPADPRLLRAVRRSRRATRQGRLYDIARSAKSAVGSGRR